MMMMMMMSTKAKCQMRKSTLHSASSLQQKKLHEDHLTHARCPQEWIKHKSPFPLELGFSSQETLPKLHYTDKAVE